MNQTTPAAYAERIPPPPAYPYAIRCACGALHAGKPGLLTPEAQHRAHVVGVHRSEDAGRWWWRTERVGELAEMVG